jgi:hypothetical protein
LELKDEVIIGADREKVFRALNDPNILKQAIPGCEAIEKTSDDNYNATVVSKIGPLKIRFKGQATISESNFPSDYKITGEGRGGPAGHAKVVASVSLTEKGKSTRLTYVVQADIGGKLAQLGGALVQKTAKKLSTQFFEHLNTLLSSNSLAEKDTEEISMTNSPTTNWAKVGAISTILVVGILAWIVSK